MMNYHNPELPGATPNMFEFVDLRGAYAVKGALQDLYDDRASNSIAGAIGEGELAQEAIAASLVGQYQECGVIGPIEDHFTDPAPCLIESMRARTQEIERDYSYSDLESLLFYRTTSMEKHIMLPADENSPQQFIDMYAYRSSGKAGVALEIGINDTEGYLSTYEIKMSQLNVSESASEELPMVLKMVILADVDNYDRYPSGERLIFDIPEFHKSIVTNAIRSLLADEIEYQFRGQISQVEKIMNETKDPVELRNRLDALGFYF